MAQKSGRHGRNPERQGRPSWWLVAMASVVAVALAAGCAWWAVALQRRHTGATGSTSVTTPAAEPSRDADGTSPSPTDTPSSHSPAADDDATARAKAAVEAMTLEDRAAQLVMAPLSYGTDPSALSSLIQDEHIGSVILMGNWDNGVDGVRSQVDLLQSYAQDRGDTLLVATDQEGGLVQHLQGAGFDTMPSARDQGTMTLTQLRDDAAQWGAQLRQAGVDVDLAPSVDTVVIDRASNEPIGALDRDFGLDAEGNARHAVAFIEGMRASGVGSAVKHYPGLGAVVGNTDFTDTGIVDDTTGEDSDELAAFSQAIREGSPAMVMMSLATYAQLDPQVPAAFSHTIVTDLLRERTGYRGVVISDSLSASAVAGYDPSRLGVMLIEAGGDLACVNDPSYTMPILEGIRAKAATDEDFAAKVTASAVRVMTLKMQLEAAG